MSGNVPLAEAVLGVNTNMRVGEAYTLAYGNLMGRQYTLGELMVEADRLTALNGQANISQSDREARIVSHTLEQILIGGTVEYSNTLLDWPRYQKMMERHGQKIGGVALMIGSISPLSSRAFSVLAEEVYGADQAVVIDVKGSRANVRQAPFVFASGTEMPFADESVSYVHTNRLIHMLKDPREESAGLEQAANKLFAEIGRVLKPGGQLLMEEMTTCPCCTPGAYSEISNLECSVANSLKSADVEIIEIDTDVRGEENSDFLFDPDRNFAISPKHDLPSSINIFGRKAV